MSYDLYSVCKFCLFDGAYLFYALLVFAVSILAAKAANQSVSLVLADPSKLPPMPGGELPLLTRPPEEAITAKLFAFAVSLASFSFFLRIAKFGLRFIRALFLMNDNPTALRSFLRYLNVYYLIILLPAAFMPPVSQPQRPPDFQLMAAVLLLMCINAIGDVISVRIILNIFKKFQIERYADLTTDGTWSGVKQEALYYFAVVRAGTYSLVVLTGVLICSSILYGVQVGQMDFGFTGDFFSNVWDRILKFPEVASTMYWFRNQPGPFGWTGIPGLLIYGLSTFLPIIILSFLATIWLLLIPFRIAVNLPPTTPAVVRVISAEVAVFVMCMLTSVTFGRFLYL
jgi:hypothetical protein